MGRLAEFIACERDALVREWGDLALARSPRVPGLTRGELEASAHETLDALLQSLDASLPPASTRPRLESSAKGHAISRLAHGYALPQVAAEYRVLRAEILRRWFATGPTFDDLAQEEIIRFNATVDRLLVDMTHHYTADQERARDLLLGTLGHDLRNPLNALVAGARYLERRLAPGTPELATAVRLLRATRRMSRLVADLLDATRTKLGTELPLQRSGVNLEDACQQVIDELREVYPDRRVWCLSAGDVSGEWDAERVLQMLSNLVGNALVHGDPDEPVTVMLRGGEQAIEIEVRNAGAAIPETLRARLFEPMVQAAMSEPGASGRYPGVGLGLYIVREIVRAHGGTIDVRSTEEGTIFAISLPRPSATAGDASRPPG